MSWMAMETWQDMVKDQRWRLKVRGKGSTVKYLKSIGNTSALEGGVQLAGVRPDESLRMSRHGS